MARQVRDRNRPSFIKSFDELRSSYPEWEARTVDLSQSLSVKRENFPLGRNRFKYVLQHLCGMYPSIGADPTAYVNILVSIVDESQGIEYMRDMPLVNLMTPGIFNPNGKLRNQQYFGARKLDFIMLPQSSFEIVFSNFKGANKPDKIDLLLVGRRLRKL